MQKPIAWLSLLLSFNVSSLNGQEPEALTPPAQSQAEPKSLVAVRAIRSQIETAAAKRAAKQQELIDAATVVEKEALAAEIQSLNSKITSLTAELESIATGIEINQLEEELDTRIEFADELKEFFRPLVQEGKRATAKPRELEQLRTAIRFHSERLEIAEKAIKNLNDLIEKTAKEEEKQALQKILDEWKKKQDDYNNKLVTAQYQLDQRIENEDSLMETLSKGVGNFFRTRGKNILIALVAMAAAFFLLRFVQRSISRFSPLQKRGHAFAARLFDVLFSIATVLLTVSTGLAALYALGDWMLLGFSLILLAGFLWASKEAIMQLSDQVKLLLNLGPVREGERIVVNGLPWQVKRIGVYTRLTNPALEGGQLRLPLRDLIPLSSRPFEAKEPYFCCESGDWVILADGTYGKVIRQTPEWIQVVLLGSTIKTFTTSDFLGQTPRNISRGFRINQVFGVDYEHQKIATSEIPKFLQGKVTEELGVLIGEENVVNVRAEFASAGASSLDIAVIADIDGAAAPKYNQVDRAIQRSCVEACNEHGWIIPFTQITLHQAAAAPV